MRFAARVSAVGVLLACSQATVVWSQARPMIERIVPTAGPPGTRVRIEGRGFSRGLRVLFNEQPVTPTEVLPERITVTLPDDARSGRFVLALGADETESPDVFRVTDRAPGGTSTVSSVGVAASTRAAIAPSCTVFSSGFAEKPVPVSVTRSAMSPACGSTRPMLTGSMTRNAVGESTGPTPPAVTDSGPLVAPGGTVTTLSLIHISEPTRPY